MQYIKIHTLDNVVVALADLAEGIGASVDNQTVMLRQDVARRYKFALTDTVKGANIIKCSLSIGYALAGIAAGERAHTYNTRTNLSDLDQYCYQPDFRDLPAQAADHEVQIYRYASGDIRVRNELWILSTVGYANGIAWQIQNRFLKEIDNAKGANSAFLFNHTHGCSQLGNNHINTHTVLQNMVHHPDAGAVLVIGLGRENNQVAASRETLDNINLEHAHFMICQQQDDEIEIEIVHLHQLHNAMRSNKREPGKLSELKSGLKCGGSDSLSGIATNLTLGRFSDYVTANDGTTILAEAPEVFGAEQSLMNHCRDEIMSEKLVTMVNDSKQYFIAYDQPIYENPSSGSKAGGITALEDRSLSYIQKTDFSVAVGVLRCDERLKAPGLNLLSASGNDTVVTSALVGAGCHMMLFSISRSTPYDGFIPAVKIATNSELAVKKKHWTDFDVDQLIHDKTISQLLEESIDTIVEFANGKQTCNECNSFRELTIFGGDVTLQS